MHIFSRCRKTLALQQLLLVKNKLITMRMDLGAQIAVSLLAHIGVFFAANQLMSTTDLPNLRVLLNSSDTNSYDTKVQWLVTSKISIASVQLSIFNDHVTDLFHALPAMKNFTSGVHTFTNLQPNTTHNICLLVRTKQNTHVSKCINVHTKPRDISRLRKIFPRSDSNHLTVLFCILILGLFIAIVASSYNMYLQSLREQKKSEYRILKYYQNEDTLGLNKSNQLRQPLLAANNVYQNEK
ncbi:uncharacterized protein LOC130636511 [Hydractinia symbiolongicarpus]|uniref:uncharacterized protein LOC130636511 n=1 Tax=Hydractinia symbiolongicarpus TaxID=13093 RepID=UPI0025506DFF|nr:uncharacterized protein LOC130636511 [Hydractinia symbiolongicarpus]